MDDALRKIIMVMEDTYNKDISCYDKAFLLKSIENRRLETGACDTSMYADSLLRDKQEAESFYNSLHISYSRFFRDPVTFAFLEQSVLPDIIAKKQSGSEIRIWSAGCANGQEAYSLSILLTDLAETLSNELRYRIFATDISREALAAAVKGQFDENMVLEVKTRHLNKYFIKQDKYYTIVPELKNHIRFSFYDLLDQSTANLPDSIYGDFDIVLCSNVLIYYKAEVRRSIVQKLQRAVSPGGYLITGDTEKVFIQDATKLHMISMPNAVFQKDKRR